MSRSSPQAWDPARCAEIVANFGGLEGPLLPILHSVSDAFGCVPAEAIPVIAEGLNISRAEVHGAVSFYHDFRTTPATPRVVRLCRAEACQSMGGRELADEVLGRLGVDWGAATSDGEVTVEAVYCLGLCGVAPAALVDGAPVGRLRPDALLKALGR